MRLLNGFCIEIVGKFLLFWSDFFFLGRWELVVCFVKIFIVVVVNIGVGVGGWGFNFVN